MIYQPGGQIWIPCEVKPGPFPDERMVRIESDGAPWVGFVPVESLQQPITQGSTYVRAVIVNVTGNRLEARVPGEPVASRLAEITQSRVQPLAALQA